MAIRIVAGGEAELLTTVDLSCEGVFLTPALQTGTFSGTLPVTLKEFDGSKRVYLAYDGDGNVVEFEEPTLSACNTVIGSINAATSPGWGGNWGAFTVDAASDFVPGHVSGSVQAYGIWLDPMTSRLVLVWGSNYA